MTILDDIIREKEREVAALLEGGAAVQAPVQDLPARPSLFSTLQQTEHLQVIAEIKRASPSKGIIRDGVDPVKQAVCYEAAGAACISVLTDHSFFNGSYDDLRTVAQAVRTPILCKDFIIHPIQIDRAKAAGASVILLIAAVLQDAELRALHSYAGALGMEVIMEVHSEQELTRVLTAGARIIGVNNRDLRTFTVDLAMTEQLAHAVPSDSGHVLISESGIMGPADARRAAAAGASGVLVGEALMRSGSPEQAIRSLQVTGEGAGR
ncbi:indole-3-glycerol phosphate synthase [Sporosarcina sp. NCCP-2716]|uniref:indole-3-glycerol phosphate synthase TrpC n=1 Tax=Sporosarcina sp. NCCP-2716 TaxID=2943679 RepID=UPI0020403C27|nr:indole-3-glycerol phosphate synthase TrpC [Sporosarcina sp. NCCP-2716]GKV68509.1 indole-3-glycerol phosphate synthase [Sporosarcina sp. NCCP-2716]